MRSAGSKLDTAADKLQGFVDHSRSQGGLKARLAQQLADDPDFLRKLKPSLIKARAKGEAPTDQKPGEAAVSPTAPQLGSRPTPKPGAKGGPNPSLVAGAALAIGIFLAKVVDWRGHAHPRD